MVDCLQEDLSSSAGLAALLEASPLAHSAPHQPPHCVSGLPACACVHQLAQSDEVDFTSTGGADDKTRSSKASMESDDDDWLP